MANILHVALLCAGVVAVAAYYRENLQPPPYCGIHRNGRPTCCTGREDNCGFQINFKGDNGERASICYCDDFCDHGVKDDCCPDYFEVCRGQTPSPPPEPILSCADGNKYYDAGAKITKNCNECVCVKDPYSLKAEFRCENDPCLISEKVLSAVSADRYATWRAYNYTQFYGKKLKDGLIYQLGTLPLNNEVQSSPLSSKSVDYYPAHFDARTRWPGYISPVVDQEWCGSDWAITVATVAADRFAIQSNGAEKVVLSPQMQLSCNKEQKACRGGYISTAWNFARIYGLVDEECFPYKANRTHCKFSKKGDLLSDRCRPVIPQRTSRYRVGPLYRIKDVPDIMYEIMESGPVHAVMTVYQDFFHYHDGIYRHSRHGNNYLKGLHSVRIVGWGEDRGDKYWIVANSWGCDWGEDGYFRIARGQNESDIESFVVATLSLVTQANDSPVTK